MARRVSASAGPVSVDNVVFCFEIFALCGICVVTRGWSEGETSPTLFLIDFVGWAF